MPVCPPLAVRMRGVFPLQPLIFTSAPALISTSVALVEPLQGYVRMHKWSSSLVRMKYLV